MYRLTSRSVDFGVSVLDLLIVSWIQRKLSLLLACECTAHKSLDIAWAAFRGTVFNTLHLNQV